MIKKYKLTTTENEVVEITAVNAWEAVSDFRKANPTKRIYNVESNNKWVHCSWWMDVNDNPSLRRKQ